MTRAANPEFPKAILHVDGDSFFVACELTRRPWLRGKPTVTGKERGIVTAASPEAKALGITRATRIIDVRRNWPQVIILPSDYRMYSQYAERMYAIVRRYARSVEEYSIDECFADLTGLAEKRGTTYEAIARAIQDDLWRELDISFSIGVGVNKVTAKIASKWRKPHGVTVMPRAAIPAFLEKLPTGKVWGIGGATTIYLRRLGVTTAGELAGKSRAWVAEHCDRPLGEIWEEFQGSYVKELGFSRELPASIQRTRTFHPASNDRDFLWSQLSYHVEDACMRLRVKGLVADRVGFFLKTRQFDYTRDEIALPDPTAAPHEILRAMKPVFEAKWRKMNPRDTGTLFRASGVSLRGLTVPQAATGTLFPVEIKVSRSHAMHHAIDRIARKFGKHAVFLGSSFRAMRHSGDFGEPTGTDRAMDVIYLGEVG